MRKPIPSSSSSRTPQQKQSSGKMACCSMEGLKRGPWKPEEDDLLVDYINKNGEGMWKTLPKKAGLLRCGKSCRLRWMNYLRPSVKRGHIEPDEEDLIVRLHRLLGNRWSLIAGRIPGRTDNEIKNYWNTHLKKKLIGQGVDPKTHQPLTIDQNLVTDGAKSPVSSSKEDPDVQISNPSGFGETGSNDAKDRTDGHFNSVGKGSENGINVLLADEEEEEDLFSSFLNSFMNDEASFSDQSQVLPPTPSASDYRNHQAWWETMMCTPFALKQNNDLMTLLGDQAD